MANRSKLGYVFFQRKDGRFDCYRVKRGKRPLEVGAPLPSSYGEKGAIVVALVEETSDVFQVYSFASFLDGIAEDFHFNKMLGAVAKFFYETGAASKQ